MFKIVNDAHLSTQKLEVLKSVELWTTAKLLCEDKVCCPEACKVDLLKPLILKTAVGVLTSRCLLLVKMLQSRFGNLPLS